MSALSALLRLYIYALHGCATEVLYTGIWDIFYFKSLKTHGNTSIWALLIYGISTFFIEKMQHRFKALGIPLPIRALIYTVWTFIWEFSTGYVLRLFDACPWDYGPWFTYNVKGLITFEYAPLWYFGSIIAETLLIKYTLKLRWENNDNKKQA